MSVLKLKPSCKDYLWGGRRLADEYGKEYDGDVLAETWELSCHPDGPSTIVNGECAGKTLEQYIEEKGKGVLGSNCRRFRDFPILIKFIDAKQNLSIQVHPDNRYALKNEGQYGKTEMWYVMDAGKDAFLYYGFKKEISREEFARRIQEDTLLEVLRLSPSSTNIQPWKFYVIDTPEMKEKIMPAVKDFNFERMQAPQLIIFTVPTCFSEEFFEELYRQEEADGRYTGWKSPERPDVIRLTYSHKFDNDPEGLFRYASNQAFIALGCVTVAAAAIGVDSTILGGLDFDKLDEILGFKAKNERSVVGIALGYRAENDSNASRPKSRLPRKRVIEFLR